MILDIDHPAFLLGTAAGHRTRKFLSLRAITAVDVPDLASADAPAVYRFTDDFGEHVVRAMGGRFFERGSGLYGDAAAERIVGGRTSIKLDQVVFGRDYAPLDIRAGVTRIGRNQLAFGGDILPILTARDGFPVVRPLDGWDIREADASILEAYRAAVVKIAENVVSIDGVLHFRRHEPCVVVRWRPVPFIRGVPPITAAWMKSGDIGRLGYRLDYSRSETAGHLAFKRGSRDISGASLAERCFSAVDTDGPAEFLDHLDAQPDPLNGGFVLPSIEVLRPDLASPDFERLELGRSAREMLRSLADIGAHVTRVQFIKRLGAFFQQTKSISYGIKAFEDGMVDADWLDALLTAERRAAGRIFADSGLNLGTTFEELLAPPHFHRPDVTPIEVNSYRAVSR